jgi:hypothetical protein
MITGGSTTLHQCHCSYQRFVHHQVGGVPLSKKAFSQVLREHLVPKKMAGRRWIATRRRVTIAGIELREDAILDCDPATKALIDAAPGGRKRFRSVLGGAWPAPGSCHWSLDGGDAPGLTLDKPGDPESNKGVACYRSRRGGIRPHDRWQSHWPHACRDTSIEA